MFDENQLYLFQIDLETFLILILVLKFDSLIEKITIFIHNPQIRKNNSIYLLFLLLHGQQKNNTHACREYQETFFKTKSMPSKHIIYELDLSYFFLNREFGISILQINRNLFSNFNFIHGLVTT